MGRGSPSVVLVGEAPGRREVQLGRPFIGPSGRLLDYACQKGGVSRLSLAIMNAAACGPIPSAAERMKEDAVAACRPRMIAELRRLQPKTILAIGSYALRALAEEGTPGVTMVRGALLRLAPDIYQTRPHDRGTEIGSPTAGILPPLTHAPEVVGPASLFGVEGGSVAPARSTEDEGVDRAQVGGGNATKLAFSTFRPVELTTTPRHTPHFLSTFHPAHILRGGDGDAPDAPGGDSGPAVDLLYYFFLYDLVKAQKLARGEIAPWVDDLDLFVEKAGEIVHPIFDPDDRISAWAPAGQAMLVDAVQHVYDDALAAHAVACDVETDSKDAMRAHLTAIALATVEGGLSATWNAWQAAPQALELARKLLADPRIHKVFHNRIYDTIVLPRHRLPVVGPVDDTLLKHHAAFPGLPHKLQQVATQFFATRPWKDEFRRTEKDEASLVLYNGRDTMATARLSVALDKVIDAPPSPAWKGKITPTRRVYEADRQQFAVATRMREVGYFVDRAEQERQSKIQHARLDYMKAALAKDFAAIEEKWRQALARILAQTQRKKDPDDYMARVNMRYREIAERDKKDTDIGIFKPKAHKDMIALFEVLRVPILDYSKKTGAPKTDKKAMEAGAARQPLLRRIIHLREAKHLLATYIDGLPIMIDGRVHPDWSPKITGRWGAGKAQNWPKFVQGWPPEVNADGTFKTRPSGDLVTPKENPRRLVTAPTAHEILRLALHAVDPLVRMRALSGHGRILLGADFSQLELRIAGFLSCDAFLLDVFRKGLDPHSAFARECFPKQFPQLEADFAAAAKALDLRDADAPAKLLSIKKAGGKPDLIDAYAIAPEDARELKRTAGQWYRLRDLTKRAEYCGIYGGGAEVVYDSIVKDFPEVKLSDLSQLIDSVNRQMAGVVRWRTEQEGLARLNREIREKLLGRARLFPLGNFNPNIVYNFPIQAMAASLLAFGIFRFVALTQPHLLQIDRLYSFGLLDASWVSSMRAKGFDKWRAPVELILNGHDSLVAEADEEDGDRGVEALEAAMTQQLPMANGEAMTFPAEAAKGRRWSDT